MKLQVITISILLGSLLLSGCTSNNVQDLDKKTIPHDQQWGIYCLDISTEEVTLLYSTNNELSTLRLNHQGDSFVFSQKNNGSSMNHTEIYTIKIDGTSLQQLTNNTQWDLYPAWSPDGEKIEYLSYRENTLDIYTMDNDGSNQEKFYDSGTHDADIDWVKNILVFTVNSSIWKINTDKTNLTKITHPPKAGVWGNANLPFGDYDPRIHPDGKKIAFERLEHDLSPYGNYNIFIINIDGSNETRLTNTGYSQGFPTWSNTGDHIVYVVAAIHDEGTYDLYMMNSDGTENRNITPCYFPKDFLCHVGVFSNDDSKIYFIGQWWE